ncbi:hypothetical protein NMG60_11013460 [Bertholletia excelsa]
MYQSGARSPRAKGFNAKQALKISLLMAMSIWLVMQVKHSHDKAKGKGLHVHIKLGRREIVDRDEDGRLNYKEDRARKENDEGENDGKFEKKIYTDQAGHGEQDDGRHGFQDENGVPHDADNIIDSMPTDKDKLLHQEESLKEKNRARESAAETQGESAMTDTNLVKKKRNFQACPHGEAEKQERRQGVNTNLKGSIRE